MKDLKWLKRDEFPPLLAEIPDPPKQLNYRGTLPKWDEVKLLAVVGSRGMTSYGKRAVQELIAGLSGHPIVIVSGLAYGVDAEAHKAALDNNLMTIGVPGSGLDPQVIYPKANIALAKDILESGGALLSEFDEDQKAYAGTFPQRNRIMAGMSHATLMIEAKERSGSLITARLTAEYNRELLVVPGSIFSEESRGCHQFLKLGATPVTEARDILEVLGFATTEREKPVPEFDNDMHAQIFAILTEPVTFDALVETLALPAQELTMLISEMEINGYIVNDGIRIGRA